jgi:hypothetical protein|tara:strand:- start:478 stop:630 length:153 start_codon:yes stop_codon:yes gene_type:complete
MAKGKLIYWGIIIVGIGAISYMYFLSDVANKDTDADVIDEILEEQNLETN